MTGPEKPKPALLAAPEAGPSAEPKADERGTQGEEAAQPLTERVDLERMREIMRVKKLIKEARGAIEKAYKRRRGGARTQRVEFSEGLMILTLQHPLDEIRTEWIEEIRRISAGKSTQTYRQLKEKYGSIKGKTGRIHEIVKTVEYYLDRMKKEKGWITPEVLAKMFEDASEKASIMAKLLASPENQDLIDAFKWAVNMTGAEGEAVAMDALRKHSLKQFPNGPLMDAVWMILSFIKRKNRVEIAQNFKKQNPGQILAFLETGNERGVFGPDEIEEVMGKKDEEKRREYAEKWKAAHDVTEEARLLAGSSYGAQNDMNRMFTLKNIGLFIGQVAAVSTIAGNVLVGAFKSGSWDDPVGKVKAMFNSRTLIAAGGLGLIHQVKKGTSLGQTFAGKEKRDTLARRQAVEGFNEQISGNPRWPEWDQFFKGNDFAGARVFYDFVQSTKAKKGAKEINPKKVTPEAFLAYLETEAGLSKPRQENINYRDLIEYFKRNLANSSKEEMLAFAGVFDNFEIGAAEAEAKYNEALQAVEAEA